MWDLTSERPRALLHLNHLRHMLGLFILANVTSVIYTYLSWRFALVCLFVFHQGSLPCELVFHMLA